MNIGVHWLSGVHWLFGVLWLFDVVGTQRLFVAGVQRLFFRRAVALRHAVNPRHAAVLRRHCGAVVLRRVLVLQGALGVPFLAPTRTSCHMWKKHPQCGTHFDLAGNFNFGWTDSDHVICMLRACWLALCTTIGGAALRFQVRRDGQADCCPAKAES